LHRRRDHRAAKTKPAHYSFIARRQDRGSDFTRIVAMTRTQLKFTILAGALALPGLTSCVPVMLAGQASSMFNHSATPARTPANDGTVLSMHPATSADREASNSQPNGAASNAAGGMAAGLGGGAGGGNSWSSMLSPASVVARSAA
jgi:hypothetical protein